MSTRPLRPLALVLLLALGACGGGSDAPAPGGGPDEPRRGGTLRVAFDVEPDHLNPLVMRNARAAQVLGVLHRGLLRLQPDMGWQAGLALQWNRDERGRELTFHLRQDLRWSDGSPFTSEDIVRSYELYADERVPFPSRSLLSEVEDVRAEGPYTVVMEFSGSSPEHEFRAVLNPLPAAQVAKLDPASVLEWPLNTHPVTLGPYEIESWQRGQSMTLVANEDWPEQPWIQRVKLSFVPDATTRVLQLELGEVDLAVDLPYAQVERLRGNEAIQLVGFAGRSMAYLLHDTRNPVLADARVRQAITHAIDRRAIIDGVYYGYATVAATPLPPVLWAHHPGLLPLAHEPARARELLAAAGLADADGDGMLDLPGGEALELITRAGDPVREAAAERIRADLAAVGLELRLRPLDLGATIGAMQAGEFDLVLGQFGSSLMVDPSPLFASDGPFNFGGWQDATADSLIAGGLAAPTREEAMPWWRAFQEHFQAEQPWTMLYYPHTVVGLSAQVRGATPTDLSPLWGLPNWWLADGEPAGP